MVPLTDAAAGPALTVIPNDTTFGRNSYLSSKRGYCSLASSVIFSEYFVFESIVLLVIAGGNVR